MNERVLIVDDEPSIHEVVRAYLEREGFIVYSARHGHEALDLALSKRPQLVVLDLMLPDISGEEICRQLRERSDVAILMLTAKTSEEQRVAGLQLGADDYLTKPSAHASWSPASRRFCAAPARVRCRSWSCCASTRDGSRSTACATRSGSRASRST